MRPLRDYFHTYPDPLSLARFLILALSTSGIYEVLFSCCSEHCCHPLFNLGPDVPNRHYALRRRWLGSLLSGLSLGNIELPSEVCTPQQPQSSVLCLRGGHIFRGIKTLKERSDLAHPLPWAYSIPFQAQKLRLKETMIHPRGDEW